ERMPGVRGTRRTDGPSGESRGARHSRSDVGSPSLERVMEGAKLRDRLREVIGDRAALPLGPPADPALPIVNGPAEQGPPYPSAGGGSLRGRLDDRTVEQTLGGAWRVLAGGRSFLVGCGWFDDQGGFVTEQHLLVEPAAERSMLQAVAERLGAAGALVSFNGKSFDAPVLDTRYAFHRLEPVCTTLPHIDVLHPARRFWGARDGAQILGPSPCSLVILEKQVLGARRSEDVAGFDI